MMNNFKYDSNSSLTKEEQLKHPEWVGKYREVKQMFQEEQGLVECYV